MAGTKEGGIKARKTNLSRYGKNFYQSIGSLGGKAGSTGGFFMDSKRATAAGQKGGKLSRRGKREIIWETSGETGKVTNEVFKTAKEAREFLKEVLPEARKINQAGTIYTTGDSIVKIQLVPKTRELE